MTGGIRKTHDANTDEDGNQITLSEAEDGMWLVHEGPNVIHEFNDEGSAMMKFEELVDWDSDD